MPQYVTTLIWLVAGICVGSVATWVLIRRRFDDIALQRRQVEEIRELERQLHVKDCEHLDALTAQKQELLAAREAELRNAIAETREVERAEFERLVNSFSVKVSPYAKVSKTGSRWRRQVQRESGYQYQLFVNGVPAFAPHVEITQSDHETEIDEESLLRLASQATEVAAQGFGAVSQFVQIARPVLVKQLVK
ncbi:MAG: hypothetical protein CVT59_04110 [Actinobacteria bacterium HGW-Actinobacteria-1]|jgi:hypothetical protein|nr:MAG: hypothetical protein CVT59_04110 [Actinobacteria bacterium HGW-Actinobacteria-1]